VKAISVLPKPVVLRQGESVVRIWGSRTRLKNFINACSNPDSDSFTKREAAQENLYVKEKEMQKYAYIPLHTLYKPIQWLINFFFPSNRLKELKAKLKEQRKYLDELDKHMYVIRNPTRLGLNVQRRTKILLISFVPAINSPRNKVESRTR
jgi:hypothetical protein